MEIAYVLDIALLIFQICFTWKLFTKMNLPGWHSIIPFFGRFQICRKAGRPYLFFGQLVLSLVSAVIGGMSIVNLIVLLRNIGITDANSITPEIISANYQQLEAFGIMMLILGMIGIVSVIINLLINVSLAKKFDKSAGFGVGMTLLPYVFFPILAYGNSYYVGEDF